MGAALHRRMKRRLPPFLACMLLLALPTGAQDRPCSILVVKSRAELVLSCGAGPARTFPVSLGPRPQGPKTEAGDGRTPEGRYTITAVLRSRRFRWFLALSYPDARDLERAQAAGIRDPGHGVGIHGIVPEVARFAEHWLSMPVEHRAAWGFTHGCIAMRDADIDAVAGSVHVGTPVEIVP
jgi:hypothetical protein